MRFGGIVATGVAWGLSALLVVAVLALPGSPLGFRPVSASSQGLVLSGDVSGLAPGVPGTLALTVRNPGDEPAVVRTLSARISESPAGCPRDALAISGWRGALPVPAGGSASASLTVTLTSSDPACAGATWRLEYASA